MNEDIDRLVSTIHYELALLAKESTSQDVRDNLGCGPLSGAELAREAVWRDVEDDHLPETLRRYAERSLSELPDF